MEQSDFNPGHQDTNIESRITVALERISEAFRVLLWNESKDFSLSPIQIQIMIFLLNHGGKYAKVSYLAKEFNMTRATISDSVSVLEKKRLVDKKGEINDTRSSLIQLTDQGRTVAGKASMFAKEIHKPISNLPLEDKESLYSHLTGIIRYLNKAGVISMKRMCTNCGLYQPEEGCDEPFCKRRNKSIPAAELLLDCQDYVEPYYG